MWEVVPWYEVHSALVLTKPGAQYCKLRRKPFTSLHTWPSVRGEELHSTRGGPVETEHCGSRGVNLEKKSLSLRCEQPCRKASEASEVEG